MAEMEVREFLTLEEINKLAEHGIEWPREVIDQLSFEGVEGPWAALSDVLAQGAIKGFTGRVIDDGQQFVVVWEQPNAPDDIKEDK